MYPTKKLGEICEIKTGKKDANYSTDDGKYPFFTCGREILKSPGYSFDTDAILIAGNGDVGACKKFKGKFEAYQRTYVLDNFQNIEKNFLFYFLDGNLKKELLNETLGSAIPYIKLGSLQNREIPLPPLSTQKLIVEKLDMIFAEIEKSQNLLEKNLQNVDEMNKSVLEKIFSNDEWERKKLGEVCEIKKGKKVNYAEQGKYNYIDIGILRTNIIEQYTNDEGVFCNKNDILIAWDGSKSGTVGFGLEGVIGSTLAKITIDTKMFSSEFIGKFLQGNFDYLNKNTSGAAIPHLRKDILINLEIPLPSLETQKNIVSYLDNIFAENQKLKNLYQAQIKNLDEMKQSFLKKAFVGELV